MPMWTKASIVLSRLVAATIATFASLKLAWLPHGGGPLLGVASRRPEGRTIRQLAGKRFDAVLAFAIAALAT
jgi:hypothetical protein